MIEEFLFNSPEDQARSLNPAGFPLTSLIQEIQRLYLEDQRPWVIGFSGGKDSTAILQLVYFAVKSLPVAERKKQIFVVSSDTLVETPLVKDLLSVTLDEVNQASEIEDMPIQANVVTPITEQSFWVNLLGKGYPAPTKAFRWCTERMKINPVNSFILEKVASYGEVVVVLGARKAESSTRAQVIAKHRIDGSRLAKHTSLPNAYVYTPIEDWDADEVWEYLMSAKCPWGGDNRALLELYKGSNSGECPIVIDTSTPSCGNSRFGCWVCTVVTTDRSMESLVSQGESWMQPLLDFRNLLAETTKPELKSKYRNYRRRSGKVSIKRDSLSEGENGEKKKNHVPGPYWMSYRREWLKSLLQIQRELQEGDRTIELISEAELHEIRKEWLNDPIEPDWDDRLPEIYREVFAGDLNWVNSDIRLFDRNDAELLKSIGDKYEISSSLLQKLMDLEASMDGLSKRRGMMNQIHQILSKDWGSLSESLDHVNLEKDGGYQEEINKLQASLDELR